MIERLHLIAHGAYQAGEYGAATNALRLIADLEGLNGGGLAEVRERESPPSREEQLELVRQAAASFGYQLTPRK